MLARMAAIVFIFLCIAGAWGVLGGTVMHRTSSQDETLKAAVGQLWGTRQRQLAPQIYYQTIKQTKVETTKGAATVTETRDETVNHPLLLDSSDVKVILGLDYRQKGLLWYSTYRVEFDGKYRVTNYTDAEREIFFDFSAPTRGGVYDNFRFVVGGKEIPNLPFNAGALSHKVRLAPGQSEIVEVGYGSRGMDEWWYDFGAEVNQVKNFSLAMQTDFDQIDFPQSSLSPTQRTQGGSGWELKWQYTNLISGVKIGMVMPRKLNPGPWVSQITFAAPVSLFLFFFVVFVMTTVKRIRLHPMNYFFIGAAFFSFHLLLAYLVDHISIHISFMICSLVSIALVVSYVRLVVGNRFAFVEAGVLQFVYLALFSYTFFFERFTGLAITILCILTLFVVMQFTGKVDWDTLFRRGASAEAGAVPRRRPKTHDMNVDSVIIGAGISGLVAAHRLKKMGRELLLIECGDRVGGVIQSRDIEGFLIECGPNSLRGSHELLDLVEELNLTGELITADPRAPAYVYAGGRLHAVPMSPPALVKTKLISNSAKLRLLREPFVKARRGSAEESIASFVRRRLGDEVLERLVAPFLSGVYAGDPDELSVQACFPKLAEFEAEAGGILRGALRAAKESRKQSRRAGSRPKRSLRPYRLCSFSHGLSALPEALSKSLGDSLLTQARIAGVNNNSSARRFEIRIERHGETRTINSPTLVLATPAYVAAHLLDKTAPEIAELVAEIPYVSIASVPIAYRAEQVSRKLDGFGFLAPRGEGLRTLGSIWNSSLFAGRAPEGWVIMTNFIGGATDTEAVKLGDEELIRIVHNDLNKALGISGEPRRLPITRYEQAIPQYTLGHAARVERVESSLRDIPGLWIAGNYLRGISLGDCIKNAESAAIEINQAIELRKMISV